VETPQPQETPRLVIVTGIMGSGKSTVAQALAERLPMSVHLRGDTFRTMIVNGRVELGVPPRAEALRQIALRHRISACAAAEYMADGFTVVYQDVLFGHWLERVARALVPHPLYVVVLCPRPEVVARRDAQRDKTAYQDLDPQHFDRLLRDETPRLGLWIDDSDMTPDEVVRRVIGELEAARVTPDLR
jgi:chloramphenicol 3-O-phosphotransferase